MKLSIRILIPAVFLSALLIMPFFVHYEMDGYSYGPEGGSVPGGTTDVQIRKTQEIQENLRKTVNMLSREIGSRGYMQVAALDRAAEYIVSELKRYGYDVSLQPYVYRGNTYRNISVEIRGRGNTDNILVVGAHYDTVTGTPGADDNASGIAGLLELSRLLNGKPLKKTVRFVAFALEEPPIFRSKFMGSYVYAKQLKEKGEYIEGMICLEMIGFFSDEPQSQFFPLPFFRWFYPERGNFITLVSNIQSRDFLNLVKTSFRKGTDLPVESLSTFSIVPGIDFSDHRSFWKFGYDALMVTDTAFYRNPNYHGTGDTIETLDFERMAEVVVGLKSAIEIITGK
jgi:hypothetical protein